ncbi:MAG TPA: hypothetical protein VEC38_11060 [Candidatus Binataceae bacterium]|nr:hypothetical protein [Candidatus Binataceae bacterium]
MIHLGRKRGTLIARGFPGQINAEVEERKSVLSRYVVIGLFAFFAASGCAPNQNQMLDNAQAMALQTAVNRGQFDMGCPSATGVVLSREVVEPALQGPLVNGIRRAEFTIGVAGCDRRKSYIVVCPEGGTGCFATGPGPFHRDFQ